MSACPRKDLHNEPGKPAGYAAQDAWARKLSKTHRQTRCPACGLYVVWVPIPKRRRKS